MARHRTRRRLLQILIATGVAVLVFAGLIVGAYALDGGGPHTLRGLVIEGVPAGDLSPQELDRLVSRLSHQVEGTEIRIDLPDGPRFVTAAEMGVSLDEEAVIDISLAVGKGGTSFDRFRTWLGSFTTPRHVPLTLAYDPERAADTVARFTDLVVEKPVEPRLVMGRDEGLIVRSGEDGIRVDEAAIVARLGDQVEAGGPFDVDAPVMPLPPHLDEAELGSIADKLNALTAGGVTIAVDGEERHLPASALRVRLDVTSADGAAAPSFDLDSLQSLIEHTFGDVRLGGEDPVFEVVEDEPVVVEAGRPPLECCAPDAATVVAEAIFADRPGTIEVDPKPSEDPRLVEWARGEAVVEKVAEFTTNHECCQARVSNIQRFADIVRGVYLVPGESLSLNEHVGQRTREKGFVPAGTILRGHLVPTVGGGVSQFATTMFNAAFFAGFDFLDYQSHSIYFSRYPYGREATISWPAPDLVIENTTDYPALIWTSYTDTSITVSIYSTRSVEVEETGQEVSAARQCTRVDTFRLRTYEDGREIEDSVFATYRPGEGFDCNGNPTTRPED
jgi:vancomycin resistance protein YoaR